MSRKELRNFVINTIKRAQKEKELPSFDIPEILVEFPEREEHGDYFTNAALLIGKSLKENPMKVAEILVKRLKEKRFLKKVEAKEPGFINFWLSEEELLDSLKRILREKDKFGSGKERKTVVIDYSAPNIAKRFGVGHLRSTIIGQAIYNIYQFLGWKCIGDNHLGDWGTQFGKLIVAIKKWNQKPIQDLSVEELENFYIKFHQEAEKDAALLSEARQWFQRLEKQDREAVAIWKVCVEKSKQEFDKIYKILSIKIDYSLGESFYRDKIQAVIEDAQKRGLAKKSQGALVIFVPGFKTPLMLLKSDGSSTYQTRELATIKYRMEKWKPDLVIYEVGADQKEHLAKSFAAAEMLGYGKREQFIHVAHGLIRWASGKFSTRKGDTIHLEDILNESIERAEKLIMQGCEETIPKKEKEETAQEVGVGAIKYNDLSRHPTRDVIFNWENILTLEGNSGPYLQYTGVRCKSILRKNKQGLVFAPNLSFSFNKEEELILRKLQKFPEVVREAASRLSPNLICSFAYGLSKEYNMFYEKCPILNAETEEKKSLRIALTKGTLEVLKSSLKLLGISIPERM